MDGINLQLENGTIQYPSENAAVVGLMVYQLIVGMAHPITSQISFMRAEDQDSIYDFLYELNRRGLNLKGQFLNATIQRVVRREPEADPSQIAALQAREILELARRWQYGDHTVWSEIEEKRGGSEAG